MPYTQLQFSIKNLGCIEEGHFALKPLTLLCGPNNTGKTWAMYALYGFLNQPTMQSAQSRTTALGLDAVCEQLEREGTATLDLGVWLSAYADKLLDECHRGMKRRLPEIFRAEATLFARSQFDWICEREALISSAVERSLKYRLALGSEDKEYLRVDKPAADPTIKLTLLESGFPDLEQLLVELLISHLIGSMERRPAFLMPAERNGLHLFFRELRNQRTALLHHAAKEKIDLANLLRDVLRSRYAEPIAHYIDWLNELPTRRKNKNGPFHALAEDLKRQLIGGRYDVDAEGNINFTPYKKSRGNGGEMPTMELLLSSSTVKSLVGLWFYLEHQAQPGDVLMIDEPELNLHPSNQRQIARLIVRLVNAGLNVVASTHSDYLVREINSMIMLSRPHPEHARLMRLGGFSQDERLSPDKIGAYLFDQRELNLMEVNPEEGIVATTFDEVIHSLNETSDEIFYAYRDIDEEGAPKVGGDE